jgi:hypothetical protein
MLEDPVDVDDLLAAVLADASDEVAADRLAGLIRADPTLAQRHAGLLVVDRLLGWRSTRIDGAAFTRSVTLRLHSRGDSARFTKAVVARLPRRQLRWWPWAIAAGLLCAIGLYAALTERHVQATRVDGTTIAIGDEFVPAAPLEIRLSDGSRVCLEAAAHWRWSGSGGGVLLAGGARFAVAPQRVGGRFAVELPHARLIALGTAFSVIVQASGWTVHVDEGSVQASDAGIEDRHISAGGSLSRTNAGWAEGVQLLGPGLTGWSASKAPGVLGMRELPATGLQPWSLQLELPPQALDAPAEGWWATVERAWVAPAGRFGLGLALRSDGLGGLRWGMLVREHDGDVWLVLSCPLQRGVLNEVTWWSDAAPIKLLARQGDGRFDPAMVQGIGITAAGIPGTMRIERCVAWTR